MWLAISYSNIKYTIGKSIFAVNIPLKRFLAAVANADIKSLMSLIHPEKMFVLLVKF